MPPINEKFNPFKCDLWSLGACFEEMIGKISEEPEDEEKILSELLTKIKHNDWMLRFDAFELSDYLNDNKLSTNADFQSLIKKEEEIVSELNQLRRKEAGFKEVYERLKDAYLPNEMLQTAEEEHNNLIEAIGELDSGNETKFAPVLGRLGKTL